MHNIPKKSEFPPIVFVAGDKEVTLEEATKHVQSLYERRAKEKREKKDLFEN